jgi:anti-anti-sigma factor
MIDRATGDPLTIEAVRSGTELILRLVGRLDIETVGTLRASLERIDPLFTIALDLSGLSFVDSSGIGEFVRARRTAEDAGSVLVLRDPNERTRFLLDLTGLEGLIG